MFSKEAFLGNWQSLNSSEGPYGEFMATFMNWVVENQLSISERFRLAEDVKTDPGILAMLAFDKGHKVIPGDIRYAVASNPSTPSESLEMIVGNDDRKDWGWDDWLDYENDDWSEDVDMVAEYGNDISQEVSSHAKSLAQANLSALK